MSMVMSLDRLLSAPIDVLFMGFSSTTYAMQRCGWRLAAHEEPGRSTIQLAAELEFGGGNKIRMISDPCRFDYFDWRREAMRDPRSMGLVFHMNRVAADFIAPARAEFASFRAIDAEPQFIYADEPRKLSDFHIFARPEVREEIIVEPSSVAECLDIIRKLQAPDLAKIRERNRMRENAALSAPVFHAQILSLAA